MKRKHQILIALTIIAVSIMVLVYTVISFMNKSEVSASSTGTDHETSDISDNLADNTTDNAIDNTSNNTTVLTGTGDELVYCVGSVSKVYSTAAVMQLVDEGKVRLDGSVTDYIPDFKMADERYKDITVRMLMDHTSGIMGTTQKGDFLYGEADTYYLDNLLNVLATQRLKADPGEYVAYCNDGFDLLVLIVENVTGMTYTEYIKQNLADKTGGMSTETGLTVSALDNIVPGIASDNMCYENEYVMCLGAGGVYSTASDVADFGAGFFKGNDVILSEDSKNEMAKRSSLDKYMDGSGLGWDYAGMDKYERAGVKLLAKGGDALLNHAFFCVAPEENISIAVLANGGSSSYNGAFAMALMDIILEDRGIKPEEENAPSFETVSEIPEEYMEFTGLYTSAASKDGTAAIYNISFPEKKYMHVTSLTPFMTENKDYMLTGDGSFAELAYELESGRTEDARISANPTSIRFVKGENGKIYFTIDSEVSIPSIGKLERKTYAGEKLEANPVNESAAKSWKAVSGKEFAISNDIFSSRWYDGPFGMMFMFEGIDGYIYANICGFTRILKILDETHAIAFQSIPSSINRDLIDVTLIKDEKGTRVSLSTGIECIFLDDIPVFDNSVKEIELKDDEAGWFRIGDGLAGSDLTADRPEGSYVYVFNKFSEMIYSTHVTDSGPEIPLPKDGYILFLGKNGEKIEF